MRDTDLRRHARGLHVSAAAGAAIACLALTGLSPAQAAPSPTPSASKASGQQKPAGSDKPAAKPKPSASHAGSSKPSAQATSKPKPGASAGTAKPESSAKPAESATAGPVDPPSSPSASPADSSSAGPSSPPSASATAKPTPAAGKPEPSKKPDDAGKKPDDAKKPGDPKDPCKPGRDDPKPDATGASRDKDSAKECKKKHKKHKKHKKPKNAKPGQPDVPQAHNWIEQGVGNLGIHGIDVSMWQHPADAVIDWKTVRRTGVEWMYTKCSDGLGTPGDYDYWGLVDIVAAAKVGIPGGCYHYAQPHVDAAGSPVADALAQAAVAVRAATLPRGQTGLPIALDLEETHELTPAQLSEWAVTFLTEVRRLTSRTPWLYASRNYLSEELGAESRLAPFPVWVAAFGLGPKEYPEVPVWANRVAWQFTGQGVLDGIPSDSVDLNVFSGKRALLKPPPKSGQKARLTAEPAASADPAAGLIPGLCARRAGSAAVSEDGLPTVYLPLDCP